MRMHMLMTLLLAGTAAAVAAEAPPKILFNSPDGRTFETDRIIAKAPPGFKLPQTQTGEGGIEGQPGSAARIKAWLKAHAPKKAGVECDMSFLTFHVRTPDNGGGDIAELHGSHGSCKDTVVWTGTLVKCPVTRPNHLLVFWQGAEHPCPNEQK